MIRIVVQHVVFANHLPNRPTQSKVVNGVVCAVVEKVAKDKTRKERFAHADTHGHQKREIEKYAHRNARAKRHDQTVLVRRIVVMHAVKEEVETLSEG